MTLQEVDMAHQILINSLDTAALTCPHCGRTTVIQVSEYKLAKERTRIKCRCLCGHTYPAVLEKRDFSKQDIQLMGIYKSAGKEPGSGKMTVKRINSRGLTLKTNKIQKIRPGQKLKLEFVLDDAKQSIVKRTVVVKAAGGQFITAEFNSREHLDNLGPYLFFNKFI